MRQVKREWLQSLFVMATLVLFATTGCQSMKAEPSKGAGFVPMDEMSKRADLPFQKAWVQADVDWKQYKLIYVGDVDTHHLLQANWWQENFRKEDMQKDVHDIALYMQNKFKEAFRADPLKRFQVVDTPEPGSLTVELALTELVPSNPVLEAAAMAAPYGGGVAVHAVAKETGATATVAFESKIVDTDPNMVLAMFADREQGKTAPVNLRALTWYGEAHGIIDEWAQQFVQIANKQPGEIVKDSSPFTLMPW